MSLRTRLVLAAAYLLATVVVALEVPLALSIDRRLRSEFEANLLGEAAVVAAQVADLTHAANRTVPSDVRSLVAERARSTGARIVLVDAVGRVIIDSDGTAGRGEDYLTPARPEFREALVGGRVDTRRRHSDEVGDDLLLVTVPVVDQRVVVDQQGDRTRDVYTVGAVRVSEPLSQVAARVRRTLLALALIGLAVVAGGIWLAWLLARSVVRPVDRLEDAARRLGGGDLDARAPEGGPAEVATTAAAFNQMADTLARNLEAQRDFVANASHQLRTPLTGLKLRLEAIEADGGPPGEQASKAQREVDRLTALVNDLLVLARGSSVEETGGEVDLARAAREAGERWAAPAERAGKRLTVAADAAAPAWTSAGDVAQVLDNLVENALRYTPAGSAVEIAVLRRDGGAALVVSDDGPGIPDDDRPHLFDRFYRGRTGREAGPGTGLGLAVVAEVVARWGGDVRLGDGPGTRIEASFPPPRAEA